MTPELSGALAPLLTALRAAFAAALKAGEVDVTDDEPGVAEVRADDWTLHLEGWPLTTAWVALDDNPSSAAEQRAALAAALSRGGLAALRDADIRLDGALTTALAGSDDTLSMTLASMLRE